MSTAITPFVLIIIGAFMTALCAGAAALRLLAKRTKFSQIQTARGESIHVESPIGIVDVHYEAKLDPRLRDIPLYPGAMPENPLSVEKVTSVNFGGRTMQDVSATYWTPEPLASVWDLYRNAMPDWPRNLSETQGKELIQQGSEYVRRFA